MNERIEVESNRTGNVSQEMLRRAMYDARQTDRATRVGAERAKPALIDQDLFQSAPNTSASHTSARQQATATRVAETIENDGKTLVTPWHQTLVERFFTAPEPSDPLVKNGRLYFVLVVFVLACTLVAAKLFKVQVLDHDHLSQIAQNQYKIQVPIYSRRGLIRDRNGAILATNAYVVHFAVDPKSIQNPEHLAELFSRTFHKPKQTYLAIFRDTSRRYIVVEHDVPQEVASVFDSVKDRGLLTKLDTRREYAYHSHASHILGFTSHDDKGLAGVELAENKVLAGENGFQIMERDGHRSLRPDVDYETVAPKDGADITLTIDETAQTIVENALDAGVAKAKAEAGMAIVMRPQTGEILALANDPDFDPNKFGAASNDDLRNRTITDAFEPGSIIKVITAAAALEDGAMKPDDKVYAENGRWETDGATFIDTHEYGTLTFRAALEKSSNISFAKISDKLDRRRFYKYLRDFGLGVYTGIDLPGEIMGYVRKPSAWGTNSKRYMAFGYELTTTAIQMANVYSTIANGGVMMKPFVVAKSTREDGKVTESHPQEIRRVISETSARTLIGMMEGVVDSGTATSARIKGLRIAGKTGTAQQLVEGHYSKEHYTSSFAGFFPADKPEYMILVILRSPHNGYYGGAVSAPIWREIAMRLLERDGKLPPEARKELPPAPVQVDEGGAVMTDGAIFRAAEQDPQREMPEVRGLTLEAGRSLLASQGFTVVSTPRSDGVIDKAIRLSGDSVRFIMREAPADGEAEKVSVPDFVRLPMARAMNFGAASGVRTKLVGMGTVTRQFPEAGTSVDKNAVVTLFGDE